MDGSQLVSQRLRATPVRCLGQYNDGTLWIITSQHFCFSALFMRCAFTVARTHVYLSSTVFVSSASLRMDRDGSQLLDCASRKPLLRLPHCATAHSFSTPRRLFKRSGRPGSSSATKKILYHRLLFLKNPQNLVHRASDYWRNQGHSALHYQQRQFENAVQEHQRVVYEQVGMAAAQATFDVSQQGI